MADRRDFFEELIFRSMGSHRFTQDSPILPDVWLAYGLEPRKRHELLLTPHSGAQPHELARKLREQLRIEREETPVSTAKDPFKTPRRETDKAREGRLHSQHLAIWGEVPARVAFHRTAVVADLAFHELIRIVLPMSGWWHDKLLTGEWSELDDEFNEDPRAFGAELIRALTDPDYKDWRTTQQGIERKQITAQLVWLVRLVGTIALLARASQEKEAPVDPGEQMEEIRRRADEEDRDPDVEVARRQVEAVIGLLHFMRKHVPKDPATEKPLLEHVNRNRATEKSLYDSDKAVKGDAVRQLFSVGGAMIRWAVVDSGIDASHVAFRRRGPHGRPRGAGGQELDPAEHGRPPLSTDAEDCAFGGAFIHETNPRTRRSRWIDQTRIEATYDFTRLRTLLSATENELDAAEQNGLDADPDLAEMLERARAAVEESGQSFSDFQQSLRRSLKYGSRIDWELLEPLLRIPHRPDSETGRRDGYRLPGHHHGTHVAGIIGADWRVDEHQLEPRVDRRGLAPEIRLYDLRALGADGSGDEFSIMGALQFIRHLNGRKASANEMQIHGVNLSFSILHDVSNYACGRTPVCEEAERLVGAGVVVVAAAGNEGRARYRSPAGHDHEGYRSISITDPGNADGVITVGATHRSEPHTYGVSYFSSRGPTGDGRRKPDLVAPGERIYSTVPEQGERDLDGTSMAAPHVSGAAALLMERHFELIGQPRRVKEVLCSSATDLGREPYFQGAGMLDVLRALQSV